MNPVRQCTVFFDGSILAAGALPDLIEPLKCLFDREPGALPLIFDDATGDIPPTALPSSGRVGIWLERRPSRMETGADRHRWLVLDYQVTNAPQTLTTIELPALTLNLRSGPPLRIDA